MILRLELPKTQTFFGSWSMMDAIRRFRFGNAVHDAVIAAIGAILGEQVGRRVYGIEQREAQLELGSRRVFRVPY